MMRSCPVGAIRACNSGKTVMKRLSLWVLMGAGLLAADSGCARRGDFELKTYDGGQMALSDLKGKIVLLSFGAVG